MALGGSQIDINQLTSKPHVGCCFSEGNVLLVPLTMACNQHCIHCMRSAEGMSVSPVDIDNLHSSLQAAFDLIGSARVVISGGEPTLVPNLVDVIRDISNIGMPINLCTNATLVDPSLANRLFGAGLRRATVGIEGVGQEYERLRGSTGSFPCLLDGISSLNNAGIIVNVNLSVHNNIFLNVKSIGMLLQQMQIDEIRITIPIVQGRLLLNENEYSMISYKKVVDFADQLSIYVDKQITFRIPRCNLLDCPSGISVFSLDADGSVKGCPDKNSYNVCDNNYFDLSALPMNNRQSLAV